MNKKGKVKIKRNIFGKITIEVEEAKILFYYKYNNKYISSSGEELEPNDFDDYGVIYYFVFSDGERTNRFSGQNILDYGRSPRKNATLALRTAREIKEKVLDPNHIRTMISSRLQHWEKYRNYSHEVHPKM